MLDLVVIVLKFININQLLGIVRCSRVQIVLPLAYR